MAKIGLPKGSGKRLKVREKTVKSQGILKWILSGNPDYVMSASHYQSRFAMYIRGLIPRNWPRPFQMEKTGPRGL